MAIPLAGIAALGIGAITSSTTSTVFAEGTVTGGQTDHIVLQIDSQCSFMNTASASAENGNFVGTGVNGTEVSFTNNGKHSFNVLCNQISGYTVKAYATDLTNPSIENSRIEFVTPSAYDPRGGDGVWTAEITDGNEGAVFSTDPTAPAIIKSRSNASSSDGDNFFVTYRAYIGRGTMAGAYTGDAVYTLSMNPLTPDTYTYSITYNAETGVTVPQKLTGQQDINEPTITVTLSNLVPYKDDQHLAGWRISQNGDSVNEDENIVHAPGSSFTISKSAPYVNLYAVWDNNITTPDVWYVRYDANGGSMNPDSATVAATPGLDAEITITPIIPTNSDHNLVFYGWSANPEATAPDAGFKKGQTPTITLNESTPTKTIYAVWGKQYFQTVGATQAEAYAWCKGLTIWNSTNNIEYTIYDSRDEKGYLVRRLADGNCWMVQNLALPGGTTITPTDSNVTVDFTLPNSSAGGWYYLASKYMWNGNHQNATKDTEVTTSGTGTSNTGAYYSFLTATAGTGTGNSGNTTQSICPKWWQLPTASSSGSFFRLSYTAYSYKANTFNEAFNVAFTGYCQYGTGTCPTANSDAHYWSASIYDSTYGYSLSTNSSSIIHSDTSISKAQGCSVRCMLSGN